MVCWRYHILTTYYCFMLKKNLKPPSVEFTQSLLASELLTACSLTDMIHYISTISKHLLEKSEEICCLFCPGLFGNVTWLHTNTSSKCSFLASLKTAAGKVTRPGSTADPPPPAGSAQADTARCHWLKVLSISLGMALPTSAHAKRWQPCCRFIISRLQTACWPLRPDRWSRSAVWLNIWPCGASAPILCHHYFIPSSGITELRVRCKCSLF